MHRADLSVSRKTVRLSLLSFLGAILAWNLTTLPTAGVDVAPEIAREMLDITALHRAARAGDTETVRTLLDAGADVNARSVVGDTALHRAARAGDAEVVRTLLDAGADVHAQDKNDNTSLHEAVRAGDAEVVQVLLDAGADVHARDRLITAVNGYAVGRGWGLVLGCDLRLDVRVESREARNANRSSPKKSFSLTQRSPDIVT